MSDKPIHIGDFRMEMFAANKKTTDHHNIGEQTITFFVRRKQYSVVSE